MKKCGLQEHVKVGDGGKGASILPLGVSEVFALQHWIFPCKNYTNTLLYLSARGVELAGGVSIFLDFHKVEEW